MNDFLLSMVSLAIFWSTAFIYAHSRKGSTARVAFLGLTIIAGVHLGLMVLL